MGVDTKGRLIGRVCSEDILNFIKQRYDVNATSRVKREDIEYKIDWEHIKYGEDVPYRDCGFINFKTTNGNNRNLWYHYTNINSLENLKFYKEYDLEDMVRTETTDINLGHNSEAIEIIKDLAIEFGGWVDENDCDDKEYYPIIKNSDGSIKPIIYVTMDEIYEKFGGVVVIKK
jgi:hypothetical protein